jgi:hypothetical protein
MFDTSVAMDREICKLWTKNDRLVQLGKYLTSGRRTSGIAKFVVWCDEEEDIYACLATASQRPQSVALPSRNLKVIFGHVLLAFHRFQWHGVVNPMSSHLIASARVCSSATKMQ